MQLFTQYATVTNKPQQRQYFCCKKYYWENHYPKRKELFKSCSKSDSYFVELFHTNLNVLKINDVQQFTIDVWQETEQLNLWHTYDCNVCETRFGCETRIFWFIRMRLQMFNYRLTTKLVFHTAGVAFWLARNSNTTRGRTKEHFHLYMHPFPFCSTGLKLKLGFGLD